MVQGEEGGGGWPVPADATPVPADLTPTTVPGLRKVEGGEASSAPEGRVPPTSPPPPLPLYLSPLRRPRPPACPPPPPSNHPIALSTPSTPHRGVKKERAKDRRARRGAHTKPRIRAGSACRESAAPSRPERARPRPPSSRAQDDPTFHKERATRTTQLAAGQGRARAGCVQRAHSPGTVREGIDRSPVARACPPLSPLSLSPLSLHSLPHHSPSHGTGTGRPPWRPHRWRRGRSWSTAEPVERREGAC